MSAYFKLSTETEDQGADFSDTASLTSTKDATAEPTHLGGAGITATQNTESPEAIPPTTLPDLEKADQSSTAQSTTAMEPTQPVSVEAPAVGKHHKRNQNRKNKRKAARHGRFEKLTEDATGESIEVEVALPQAEDTNDDVAPVEESQEVVAETKENSRFSRALNLHELNIKLEKLAQASSTVANTQSVPGSFEVFEDDQFEDVRETMEDEDTVTSEEESSVTAKDENSVADKEEDSVADKDEDSVSSKDEDCTADIDDKTVTGAKGESRNACRNKKRSQNKKNKKAQNGIIVFVNSIGMTEGQKLGAVFLVGVVVGSYLTRILSYLGGN